ncbi:hypothetical protein OVY01_17490 [Robbsia sp. Bb-Pol-6]|uniref:Fluoroacetyl-CoA-specific thioesterase-like domain-containing protein n=1 Tax=Robbsia betulipollinis TaxID=2981849 RepID=A0ABT3ZQZ0_9BURK|nr:hypothetical protein [Robbsia betulipollinis]MCY0388966.1 hypothetical protein [Robbsia betulipollinis]
MTLDANKLFKVGQTFSRAFTASDALSALHFGGDRDVLATPVIVYWIEMFATECIRNAAAQRYGSVGHAVSVQHVAAAELGSAIILNIAVVMLFANSVRFSAEAIHATTSKLIARGTHDRTLFEF